MAIRRMKQTRRLVGAVLIRINDPNPDIEFVETGLTGPDPGTGKFEIAVQKDQFQLNGRKAAVSPNAGNVVGRAQALQVQSSRPAPVRCIGQTNVRGEHRRCLENHPP